MVRFFLYSFLSSLFLMSCNGDAVSTAPDVTSVPVDLDLVRYDKALMSIDLSQPRFAYDKMLASHPSLTDLYFKQLLQMYHADRDTMGARITHFLNDDRIRNLVKTIDATYPEVDFLDQPLTQALRYYKHYFPEKPTPRFYTLFTEYSYQTFIFDDVDRDGIGIGLDMFLGDDFDYKAVDPTDPAFSDYLTRTYNEAHLIKKTIELLAIDAIGEAPGKRFIDKMIHQGKKIYILKKLLPATPDYILYEYTEAQMTWMQNNELSVWDFYLELNVMYDTNHLKLSKLLSPAPTTQGMPEASPGRTTEYIGHQIVDAFMKRHPELTLKDLIAERDYQTILEGAKYKPARK